MIEIQEFNNSGLHELLNQTGHSCNGTGQLNGPRFHKLLTVIILYPGMTLAPELLCLETISKLPGEILAEVKDTAP